jgi:hypothetical protein
MKINIAELGLKEIVFTDLIGYFDEEEIKTVKEELLKTGTYWDEFIEFEKEDDVDVVEGFLQTGSIEIIDFINKMKICQDDPFLLIVKDSWDGENSGGDSVGYTSFETINEGEDPPTLKGGEYDEKSFMTKDEDAEFEKLINQGYIETNAKYKEFFFIRRSKYKTIVWLAQWLSQDYGHNN